MAFATWEVHRGQNASFRGGELGVHPASTPLSGVESLEFHDFVYSAIYEAQNISRNVVCTLRAPLCHRLRPFKFPSSRRLVHPTLYAVNPHTHNEDWRRYQIPGPRIRIARHWGSTCYFDTGHPFLYDRRILAILSAQRLNTSSRPPPTVRPVQREWTPANSTSSTNGTAKIGTTIVVAKSRARRAYALTTSAAGLGPSRAIALSDWVHQGRNSTEDIFPDSHSFVTERGLKNPITKEGPVGKIFCRVRQGDQTVHWLEVCRRSLQIITELAVWLRQSCTGVSPSFSGGSHSSCMRLM